MTKIQKRELLLLDRLVSLVEDLSDDVAALAPDEHETVAKVRRAQTLDVREGLGLLRNEIHAAAS